MSKFYKGLAIVYFIVISVFIVLIWSTGLFWETIDVVADEEYGVLWNRYNGIVDWSYFVISFLTAFVQSSFIFHKGLCIKNRSDD